MTLKARQFHHATLVTAIGKRQPKRMIRRCLALLIYGLTCLLAHRACLAQFEFPLPSVESITFPPLTLAAGEETMPAPASPTGDVESIPPGTTAPVEDGLLLSPDLGLEEPPILPVWYNPFSWIGPYWDGSFEIGINAADGNAQAFSMRTGFEITRETERTNAEIDFTYSKATASSVETQHFALLYGDWDYRLPSPRFSWFNKFGMEYDEFKEFDVRFFLNTGLGYLFVDGDHTELRGRFGAGSSRDLGGIDEAWTAEANFGFDLAHQLTDRQQVSAIVDYYPSWIDFRNYRVISNVSWEVVLDKASNLSLKINAIDRFDSQPNGAKPLDITYAMLLLWAI